MSVLRYWLSFYNSKIMFLSDFLSFIVYFWMYVHRLLFRWWKETFMLFQGNRASQTKNYKKICNTIVKEMIRAVLSLLPKSLTSEIFISKARKINCVLYASIPQVADSQSICNCKNNWKARKQGTLLRLHGSGLTNHQSLFDERTK